MARLMAEETGLSLEDVGHTTARPPWAPVPMGVLAGRPIEPAKRSAIHGCHRDLGATVQWAGDWRRAYDYGDPQGEALAVHEAAGLIDVSTLGKLIVSGPEAGAFLDRLYPNRFSNLKPGRIRYGVMTSDAGRIMDDGTICRLDDGRVLRHHDVDRRRRGRGVVRAGGSPTGACRSHMTDVTQALVRGQPRRPARPRDHGGGHRPGLLGRGVRLPRRQARAGRRRAVPAHADRLRRRGRIRDPLPGRARRVPVGRAARGRRRARPARLRARAAAHPAPAEAAHPRRPGHRLRVDPVRRRDAVDRQARQGGGLHRQVGAGARYGEQPLETTLVGFTAPNGRVPTEGAAVLGPDGAAGRPASPRRAGRRSSSGSSAWRGCPPRWPPTAPRSRSPTATGAARPRSSRGRSTTPTARCCARERFEFLSVDARSPRRAHAARAQPDGARRAGGRRALRGARRLERRGRLSTPARAPARARLDRPLAPRQARAARGAGGRRRHARAGDRHAATARLVVPGHARARAGDLPVRAIPRRCAAARGGRGGRGRRRGHDGVRRAGDLGAAGARGLRPLLRARPAPRGDAGRRVPARLGRPHAGHGPARGARTAT